MIVPSLLFFRLWVTFIVLSWGPGDTIKKNTFLSHWELPFSQHHLHTPQWAKDN